MTTNVPKPTFGPSGFQAPTDTQILAGTQADINAAFGGNLNFSTSGGSVTNATPQGQLAASEAAIISAVYAMFLFYTTQTDPAYAQGRMQDAIGRIYFMERLPALPTVLMIECNGALNVNIPQGALIEDAEGNIYVCQTGGFIQASGNVTLPFANLEPGPIAIPETVSIYQTIPGWDSATVVSGVLGSDVESRAAFETRRASTVEGNSFGAIGSILGAVANVTGVSDYWGYDNSTNSPVTVMGVTIPANSIFIAVVGGSEADVAQAIFSKKAPGCSYSGNTTVTVYDTNPLYTNPPSYSVTYEIPASLQVMFAINIVAGPSVPSNAALLIQNAVINAFAGGDGGPRASIASLILALRFVAPIAALGPWAQIRSLLIGSLNASSWLGVATISGTTLTVVSTTSGTIAAGQTLDDGEGGILAGTVIVSGGGSSWTINQSQTVGGASFTGSAGSPATELVVTSVTGTIHIGDVVSGTGITAGTTILSQISGTPGGAGTYGLSATNTASSAAITTARNIYGVVAANDSVQVNGNQEPEVVAANIAVTIS